VVPGVAKDEEKGWWCTEDELLHALLVAVDHGRSESARV
jgi:hypothetical protein